MLVTLSPDSSQQLNAQRVSTESKFTHLIVTKHHLLLWNTRCSIGRLPFGWINAPAAFQRLVQTILREEKLTDRVQVYIDDIIIFTYTKKEHYAIIKRVVDKLASRNVIVSFEKSFFFRKLVKYFGYIIDENEVSPNENVVKVVKEIQIPKEWVAKGVRDITTPLQIYIPNFSNQAKRVICQLRKKDDTIKWIDKVTKELEKIKNQLKGNQKLYYLCFDK